MGLDLVPQKSEGKKPTPFKPPGKRQVCLCQQETVLFLYVCSHWDCAILCLCVCVFMSMSVAVFVNTRQKPERKLILFSVLT